MHQGNSIKQSGSAFQSGDIQNFVFVALMTCIFSTMDNAVTVYHANGTVDIGQWPRILLALSGLMAGFLFDIAGRKYMSVIMYCVMLLSTTCLVIIHTIS